MAHQYTIKQADRWEMTRQKKIRIQDVAKRRICETCKQPYWFMFKFAYEEKLKLEQIPWDY